MPQAPDVISRDDVLRMANEADIRECFGLLLATPAHLECFTAIVAAAEREACAKVFADEDCLFEGRHIAAAIRARAVVQPVVCPPGDDGGCDTVE